MSALLAFFAVLNAFFAVLEVDTDPLWHTGLSVAACVACIAALIVRASK